MPKCVAYVSHCGVCPVVVFPESPLHTSTHLSQIAIGIAFETVGQSYILLRPHLLVEERDRVLEQRGEGRRRSRGPGMGDEGSGAGARSLDESTEMYVTGREWGATIADARENAGTSISTRPKPSPGGPGEA